MTAEWEFTNDSWRFYLSWHFDAACSDFSQSSCIPEGKRRTEIFKFAPPIVLLYLGMMLLCTMKMWNLEDTAATYKAVKNPLLYAMLFLMLLRCDLKKIIKLGPKMLIGFFAASLSICTGL